MLITTEGVWTCSHCNNDLNATQIEMVEELTNAGVDIIVCPICGIVQKKIIVS